MYKSYFIPSFVLDFLRVIRSFAIYIVNRSVLMRNNEVKNTKLGETVFILANGPSLNLFNYKEIKNTDVIVMNNFDLCTWKDKINIVAHCIGEPKHSSHWGDDQIEISNNTNALSYWYHYSVKDQIDKYNNINHSSPFYFVAPSVPEKLFFSKNFNLSHCTLGYSTTAQMCIMLAVYMGYSKINLIGFDHDFLKNRCVSPHFYKEGIGAVIVDKTSDSYLSLMNKAVKMWNRYYKIKDVVDAKKVTIKNLTKNSYLDVF